MLQTLFILFFVGILFGLSVIFTQKVLFITKNPILITMISMLRLFIIGNFFYIILKSTQIHPIILIVSFLVAYWLTILNFKELINARP